MDEKLLNEHLARLNKKIDSHTKIKVLGDKETSDLLEHLKKKGIDLTKVGSAIDLGGIKLIYTYFDRESKNKEFTSLEEFKNAMWSLVGKPLRIDHKMGKIVGHFVDVEVDKKNPFSNAYAVFYKRDFPKLWEKIQKLAKEGKLKFSWHILTPKGATEIKNGIAYLKNFILSGGSILLEQSPAYPDCYVVATAKEGKEERTEIKCHDEKCSDWTEIKSQETQTQVENKNYLYCDKCGFNTLKIENAPSMCPVCGNELRVVSEAELIKLREERKQKENEIYISCPSCQARMWSIEEDNGDEKIIRCLSCSKRYEIKLSDIFFPFKTLKTKEFYCPSCGYNLTFYTVADANEYKRDMKCPNCGMEINVNFKDAFRLKRVSSIKEIGEEDEENLKFLDDLLKEGDDGNDNN